ncbi:MAG: hypothetical protein WA009_14360, partial [Phototrophicaceae bacterium]
MTQDNTLHENANFEFTWSADDFDDIARPSVIDDPALPVTLHGDLVPITRDGMYVPNHLDESGTLHFFAPVDHTDRPEFDAPALHLSYIRAVETDDGRLVYDQHPVMPLSSVTETPFPRQTLDLMLMDGDLDNAQALAYETARSHGLPFPDPEALPPLRTDVEYRFETGIEEDDRPTIETVKTWREGNQDREARLTIASYGMQPELEVDLRELNDVRENEGLQAAMTLAEGMAVASGTLHDGRDDPRLFTDGPPDLFMT